MKTLRSKITRIISTLALALLVASPLVSVAFKCEYAHDDGIACAYPQAHQCNNGCIDKSFVPATQTYCGDVDEKVQDGYIDACTDGDEEVYRYEQFWERHMVNNGRDCIGCWNPGDLRGPEDMGFTCKHAYIDDGAVGCTY